MNPSKHYRIGIDVGGTFTKAVAVDLASRKIVGKATVPTTHFAGEGVSVGVVNVLRKILDAANIGKGEVELIAHSTTQAVNALLEGDVAKVGIIGMGVYLEKADVMKRTHIDNVKLADKHLPTAYRFLDTSHFLTEQEVDQIIEGLREEGCDVVIASEAYGVDDPSNEAFIMKRARKVGLSSTAGHELTGIYGLEIRTLTAAINASILPKTINVANFVENAIKGEGIHAPLMIMKGDGGVTDVQAFRTKPILTVLSGPAASVAGALLYLKIIDGVFIEVGGTSTNLCVIKNGKPEMKYVTIMEHPTCIRSLDVRVVGVAGGSMVKVRKNKIVDVGPRSAHIAGLPYSCFAEPDELKNGEIITVRPKENDPQDYVAIKAGGKIFAITNTCAANALGLINEGDYAYANREAARLTIELLANKLGTSVEEAASTILDISSNKIKKAIDVLIKQYELENNIVLIGGGGGASVLVPYLAKKIGVEHKIAENAEVISSIGVAAAMIHEEIERTLNKPEPNIIAELVEEAKQKAMKSGALPESIIVHSEYVAEKGLLRVTAMGNVNLDITGLGAKEVSFNEAKEIATHVAKIAPAQMESLFDTASYYVFKGTVEEKRIFFKRTHDTIVVLDKFGRVRLAVDNGIVFDGKANDVRQKTEEYLRNSSDGLAPQIHLVNGTKLIDFSGITAPEHVVKAVENELANISEHEKVAAIIKIR